MSRIDYITVGLVALCLGVLIYLLMQVARIDDTHPQMEARPDTEIPILRVDSFPGLDTLRAYADSMAVSLPQKKKAEPVSGPAKRYLVVAASFPEEALAQRELERLIGLGYEDCEIGYFNQRKIISIIAGRFYAYEEAKEYAELMKEKHKIAAYVHEKRK